jgi:hypothetical protein
MDFLSLYPPLLRLSTQHTFDLFKNLVGLAVLLLLPIFLWWSVLALIVPRRGDVASVALRQQVRDFETRAATDAQRIQLLEEEKAEQFERGSQRIQLLEEEVEQLKSAVGAEHARNEKHAAAFTEVSRAFSTHTRDMEAKQAHQMEVDRAAHDATVAQLKHALSACEAENSALKASRAAAHTELEAARAATGAQEGAAKAATTTIEGEAQRQAAQQAKAYADHAASVAKLAEATHTATVAQLKQVLSDFAVENAGLKASHAGACVKLEAAQAATVAQLNEALAKIDHKSTELRAAMGAPAASREQNLTPDELEAKFRALASMMADIHTTVTQLAVEVHPLRRRAGQFAAFNAGALLEQPKPPVAIDRVWCADACADGWGVDVDTTGDARAHVTRKGRSTCFTLRSVDPLRHPRDLPPIALAAATSDAAPTLRAQLPWYCVVVDKYDNMSHSCYLGLVPSHHHDEGVGAAAAAKFVHRDGDICTYGGWRIDVSASRRGTVHTDALSGWTVLRPHYGVAIEDGDLTTGDISAYATTTEVPPVPPGGAVGFAVDYAAGTCRVAFYTPAAVAGRFVDPPHAKMELRFVATEAKGDLPARSVPTAPGSGVQLHPAVMTCGVGNVWRFIAE